MALHKSRNIPDKLQNRLFDLEQQGVNVDEAVTLVFQEATDEIIQLRDDVVRTKNPLGLSSLRRYLEFSEIYTDQLSDEVLDAFKGESAKLLISLCAYTSSSQSCSRMANMCDGLLKDIKNKDLIRDIELFTRTIPALSTSGTIDYRWKPIMGVLSKHTSDASAVAR